MQKFIMSFVFHFYILDIDVLDWTNPSNETLKFESPSKILKRASILNIDDNPHHSSNSLTPLSNKEFVSMFCSKQINPPDRSRDQFSRLKSSMPFKRDLAHRNTPLSK